MDTADNIAKTMQFNLEKVAEGMWMCWMVFCSIRVVHPDVTNGCYLMDKQMYPDVESKQVPH